MPAEIAHADRYADIVLCERLSRGREYDRIFPETPRRKRNVGGDRDIALIDTFGDPVIRRVGAFGHDHMFDTRIAARPQTAIADDMNRKPMTRSDAVNLVLDGAGIRIDEDFQ